MGKETQSILLGLLGAVLITITASGRYTSYVKPGFGPLLMISGVVLVVLAVLTLVQTIRSEAREHKAAELARTPTAAGDPASPHGDAHGHDHDGSRAPWLILVPVLVLLLVAPAALGADSVARSAGSQAVAGLDVSASAGDAGGIGGGSGDGGYLPNDGSGNSSVGEDTSGTTGSGTDGRSMQFPPLPEGSNPPVTMKELVLRALYDADGSVATTPVTVVGFIAGAGEGQTGGYTIARVVISCCAADANPMRVHVDGEAPFGENTWVSAVVTGVPGSATLDNEYVPTVEIHSIQQVAQPADPYEH